MILSIEYIEKMNSARRNRANPDKNWPARPLLARNFLNGANGTRTAPAAANRFSGGQG